MLKTSLTYEFQSMPAEKQFKLRMLLGVTGLSKPERPRPLNLALALDKSGSMGGNKLRKALEATNMIAEMMQAEETFSLVTFNGAVETVIPPTKGSDLQDITRILKSIEASSNTNLCGGYLEASLNAKSSIQPDCMSRVIILSDGQANEGITDLNKLSAIAAETRVGGVSTTTYGIGDDFDEALMASMAESGGGASYYIDRPEDSKQVFLEEMDTLRNLVASDCRIRLQLEQNGVTVRQLNTYRQESSQEWLLGDISAIEERCILFEFDIPPQLSKGMKLDVGTIQLSWLNINGMTERMDVPISIDIVAPAEFETLPRDEKITIEAAMLEIAAAKKTVRILSRGHNFEEAAVLLENLVAKIRAESINDKILNDELEELLDRAKQMRTNRERFMDARQMKMMMFESEHYSKGRRKSYQSQKERHMRAEFARRGASDEVIVDLLIPGANVQGCCIPCPADLSVQKFLNEISDFVDNQNLVEEYGVTWVLRNQKSHRVYDIGMGWSSANNYPEDNRPASVLGITPGTMVHALQLQPLNPLLASHRPTGFVSLDVSAILPQVTVPIEINCEADVVTCDFLARIFQMISSAVGPNMYGQKWILRDARTGRVFDVGSAWANSMGVNVDDRPLPVVGILSGMVLETLPVRQGR